jgi:hypothetical protein
VELDDKVELAQAEIQKQLVPKIIKLVLENVSQYGGDGRHVLSFCETLCVGLIAGRYKAEGYDEVVDTLAAGIKDRLVLVGRELEQRHQQRAAVDEALRTPGRRR